MILKAFWVVIKLDVLNRLMRLTGRRNLWTHRSSIESRMRAITGRSI